MKTQIANEIRGVMSGDHRRALGQPAERRSIEVIEMGVRDEDQINRRKLADVQRWSEQAARAAGPQSKADAHAVGENRIGENRHVADAQENGRVADPHGCQVLLVPVVQMRLSRRGGTVQAVEETELSASTAEPVR